MENKVKIAVVGVGQMGAGHVRDIAELHDFELTAVCDTNRETADRIAGQYGVPAYYDYRELFRDGDVQAITIATPHYDHTPISIAAFERGLHVMTEKPLAVHVRDAQKMIDAYQHHPDLVFAVMFQQRTQNFWRKIKAMIDGGELGRLVRTTWIITDWFRPQAYYDSGSWRATWGGEGGGVLLNQAPHNLDLYQWFVGMPARVTGIAGIGRYHQIEVEDVVNAVFEHENGMLGQFMTTTAESPGVNRLEIAGENGRLVFENGELIFFRNSQSMHAFSQTSQKLWDKVPHTKEIVAYDRTGVAGHRTMLQNFADAILKGAPLIAPAVEGIRSASLANAILYSSFTRQAVDLPLDGDRYAEHLNELIRTSTYQKVVREATFTDEEMKRAFGFH